MIQVKHIWLVLILSLTTTFSYAQNSEDKYLGGAVPEVKEKVVFGKVLHLPGTSKEEIFQQMDTWMQTQFIEPTSRVVYKDLEEGVIVGVGNDTIVFKSTALSLDRTYISYQLELRIADAECDIQLTKINFRYQEKERYTAEEMITDKIALNKSKTKIYKGYSKWRKGTVDFANQILDDATKHLLVSKTTNAPQVEIKKDNKAAFIITSKEYKAEDVVKNIDNNSIYARLADKDLSCYLQVNNRGIKYNITNAFSGLGNLFGKERVLLTVSMSEEYYDSLDESDSFTLTFVEKDAEQALIVITCQRAIAQSIVPESVIDSNLRKELAKQPIHKLYINDIISVNINK